MKMRNWIKVIGITMILCLLAGCRQQTTKFDAGSYVKALLDCMCKGQYKEYMELTDSTLEEAKQEYESVLDDNVEALSDGDIKFTEELTAGFRTYFADVHEKTKYEVKDVAVDQDGNFTVTMQVEPLNYTSGMEEYVNEKFDAYAKDAIASGKDLPSQEEQEQQFYVFLLEGCQKALEQATYQTAIEVKVDVRKDEEGIYNVDSEDFTELFNSLLCEE